ncbi:MAG: DUF2750 domain-containing protein [Pseudomonadota bacterium]
MLFSPSIPEIAQRDRFIRRIVGQRMVFCVAGEDGLARVDSRHFRGRQATLVWSARAEAERWASTLVAHPRLKEIPLGAFLAEVLPTLAGLKRLVAPDWSADPIEVELQPMDLAERVRLEAVEAFVQRVKVRRAAWMLEDSSGPALLVSATRADQLFLPCWSSRREAETRIEGPWKDMLAVEIPLDNLLSMTLPWLDQRGWLIAPDHCEGAGALELAPAELKARFVGMPALA